MTKLFLDTEFTGLHQNTTLISLALVADTGAEFYAEFTDYNKMQVDIWVQKNVLDHLILTETSTSMGALVLKGDTTSVVYALTHWLEKFASVEIWSDCYAYDWVLFCQLFGGAINLPRRIYYIPFDLATLFKARGVDPDVSREEYASQDGWTDSMPKHNALHDARVQARCYHIMMGKK